MLHSWQSGQRQKNYKDERDEKVAQAMQGIPMERNLSDFQGHSPSRNMEELPASHVDPSAIYRPFKLENQKYLPKTIDHVDGDAQRYQQRKAEP